MVPQQAGDPRDGDDEDEIEEQLGPRNPASAFQPLSEERLESGSLPARRLWHNLGLGMAAAKGRRGVREVTISPLDGFFWLDAGAPTQRAIVHAAPHVWGADGDRYLARMTPVDRDGPDFVLEIGGPEDLPLTTITEIVSIAGRGPLQLISAPISEVDVIELAPPGAYDIGFSDIAGEPFRAIVMTHDTQSIDTLRARLTTVKSALPDDYWERKIAEFQRVVDPVLDAARRSDTSQAQTDVVLADVTVVVPMRVAVRGWRDVDSAWIYDSVNPVGRSAPNAYELVHHAPVWGQDTLTIILQYLDSGSRDEVVFRVSYYRTKRTPKRRWDEPLGEAQTLTVGLSKIDDGHTRCLVRQDSCPAVLVGPLSELWTVLTQRLHVLR